MMFSPYKLSKQGNNIQPWRIPFPIVNLLLSANKFDLLNKYSFLLKKKKRFFQNNAFNTQSTMVFNINGNY